MSSSNENNGNGSATNTGSSDRRITSMARTSSSGSGPKTSTNTTSSDSRRSLDSLHSLPRPSLPGKVNKSPSSTSSDDSSEEESAFDRLLKMSPVNKHPDPKPIFEPIIYDWEDPPKKFRRINAKRHEQEIKDRLANSGLSKKKINEYAKNASYYPGGLGSEYKPLDRVFTYSWSPGKISLSSSDSGASPKYLFKTPPREMPRNWKATTPLASPETTGDDTSLEVASMVNICETPSRPLVKIVEIDSLSPVIQKLRVKASNFSWENKSDSPLLRLPELPDDPDTPESPAMSNNDTASVTSPSPSPNRTSSSSTTSAISNKSVVSSSPNSSLSSSSPSQTEDQSPPNLTLPTSSSSLIDEPDSTTDKSLSTSSVNEEPMSIVSEAILYDEQVDPPTKFLRLIPECHEKELKEQLASSGLNEEQIDECIKNVAYFPGIPGLEYAIDQENFERMASPKHLFKSPCHELSNTLDKSTTSMASPECSRDAITSPKRTPISHGYKTPSRSPIEVESLSPVFERLKVKSTKKNYEKIPDSPLLLSHQFSNVSDSPLYTSSHELQQDVSKSPSFSLGQLYETTDNFSPKATPTTGVHVATQTSPNHPTNRFSTKDTSMTGLHEQATVAIQTSFTSPIATSMTDLEDHENQGIDVITQTSLYKPTEPIVLLVSENLSIVKQFSQAFNADIIVGEWDDRATHVIFELGSKKLNTRAILKNKFLVKLSWLEDSLKAGLLLCLEDYQASLIDTDLHVQPSRVGSQLVDEFFTGFVFLCSKPFDQLDYDRLKELLIYHGAIVIAKPSEFADYTDKIRICLVGEDRYHKNEYMTGLLRCKLGNNCLVKVKYHWVMEIFENMSLVSMKKYLFDTSTSIDVAKTTDIPKRLFDKFLSYM